MNEHRREGCLMGRLRRTPVHARPELLQFEPEEWPSWDA